MATGKSDKSRKTFQSRHDRVRRARLLNNVVLYGTITVVALVFLLIVYGVLYENFISPSQAIAHVNGEVITTEEFQGRVRFQRVQLLEVYNRALQNYQYFAQNPDIQAQIDMQLSQIEQQMEPVSLGDTVLSIMIDEALIRQEAEQLGITVTDKEVDRELQSFFSFYPQGTPTSEPTSALSPTSTLSLTQYALVTATNTPTITPTATSTRPPEARGTSAVPLTPTPTKEGDKPIPTPTEAEATVALPTLTATPYTTQMFGESFQTYIDGLASYGVDEEAIRSLVYNQILRRKVFDELTKDVPTEEEQVWLRHILVEDKATAQEIIGKLKKGDDWTELSIDYSLDDLYKERGGDLGWESRRTLEADYSADFADAALALKIGEISKPVEAEDGWHVLQVIGHEVRQLSASQKSQFQQELFNQWLETARKDADIFREEYWERRIPREPVLPSAGRQQLQLSLPTQASP